MLDIVALASSYLRAYGLVESDKPFDLLYILAALTQYHIKSCDKYQLILESTGLLSRSKNFLSTIEDLPFIHVSAFKNSLLASCEPQYIYKILSSSGTSGEKSKIVLSKENAKLQVIALSSIVTDFMGVARPTMVVLDKSSTILNTSTYSARKAAIVGFGQICRRHYFVLDEEFVFQSEILERILNETTGKLLFFGFTHIVWKVINNSSLSTTQKSELANRAIFLHGGGWKKLESQRVSKSQFNLAVKNSLGIVDIRNYYGMVEQTGTIFMECKYGNLHDNDLSTVVPRSTKDLSSLGLNIPGIAQVLSSLPTSYPGHSLLTDDLIEVIGENSCKCGRMGKTFRVLGRLSSSIPRGCSDAYK